MTGKVTYHNVQLDLKNGDMPDGNFEGYASVFDVVDKGMDVVAPGAFQKSIDSGRKVKLLWQHDMRDVIGVFNEIREDARGLFVKGRIIEEVQKGREALALMRAGAIDSMSIGYCTIEASKEGQGSVRRLHELQLFEISLVSVPMLDQAMITDVKSLTTEREFEQFLRDAGYSRKEAVAITSHGYKGLNRERDALAVKSAEMSALLATLNKIKDTMNHG